MKLTDGKKVIAIELKERGENGWSGDLSKEFFNAGALVHLDTTDAYQVEDVDACIARAEQWRDGAPLPESRLVKCRTFAHGDVLTVFYNGLDTDGLLYYMDQYGDYRISTGDTDAVLAHPIDVADVRWDEERGWMMADGSALLWAE